MLSGDGSGPVSVFLLQCCDGDAFFFADRLTAFEGHGSLPGFEVRVVDNHIREDSHEYEGERDVDELDVFHARLDG